MELKKSTKPKDTLIDIMNKRFDRIDKQIKDTNKETNKKFNKRFDAINKQIKETNKQTNKRFDKLEKEVKKDISNLDTKLNNVIKLNNLKV